MDMHIAENAPLTGIDVYSLSPEEGEAGLRRQLAAAWRGAVYYIKRRQGPHRIHLTPDAAYMYTQFDRRSFNQ